MTFKEAASTGVRFGKHAGSTIDKIAQTDDGLRYLDWLVGEDWVWDDLREALVVYLNDPAIKRDLEKIL